MNIDRLALITRRETKGRQRWSRREVTRLEALVGKALPHDMAQEIGRPVNSIISKLNQLGYRLSRDIILPLGITCIGLARRLEAPSEQVWRDVKAGVIPAGRRVPNGKKDYLIAWKDAKAYEARLNRIRNKRQRAIDRIPEPTITKQQMLKELGIEETHGTRYLQFGIVKGWKIPCMYQEAPRDRWEWRVSRADTLRVKHLRARGELRLSTRRYRNAQRKTNKQIIQLRRDLRLGKRPVDIERKCVVPGWFTVSQVVQMARVSHQAVYGAVRTNRLKHKSVKVGRHNFFAIEPTQIPAYIEWCKREVKATGPIFARKSEIENVRAAGLLTIRDACEKFNISRNTLTQAIYMERLPARHVGRMVGIKPADMKVYARKFKPFGRKKLMTTTKGDSANASLRSNNDLSPKSP